MDKKPKEPLLSLMLAFICPGLGHVYCGYVQLGIIFLIAPLLIAAGLGWHVIQPDTKLYAWMWIPVVAGVIFSLYILIDSYRCANRYNKEHNLERKITGGKRALYIFGILICMFVIDLGTPIASYIRENVVQAFKIPSGAMQPTLIPKDRILADKSAYKDASPQRGDIVVFKYPEDPSRDFIKRVVGLPGESLEIREGKIYINGQMLSGSSKIAEIYYYNRGPNAQQGQAVDIPAGHYFVMGDNSQSSHDSRFWGFVPEENLIGKAYKIYYPFARSGAIE